jgi:hypothetical protein
LRLLQIRGVLPITAAIDQPLAEHRAVQIVAKIVMARTYRVSALPCLQIEQSGFERIPRLGAAMYAFIQPGNQ